MNKLTQLGQLLADPRVKKLPRIAVILAIAYVLSPVDLVPDLLFPVVGYLDDVTLLWMSVRWLFKQREVPSAEGAIPVEGKRLPPSDR
jgi:uncharacterized membrane protein YkvA (DUF1232 family)